MKKIGFGLGLASLLLVSGLAAQAADPLNGADLYRNACSSCHGGKGEKGDKPIAGLPVAKLETIFKGYLEGSFGGENKAMMAGVLQTQQPAELEAIAAHIATLK